VHDHSALRATGSASFEHFNDAGAQGQKLRPSLNPHEVESFTANEMRAVALLSDLDGPLVDYIVTTGPQALKMPCLTTTRYRSEAPEMSEVEEIAVNVQCGGSSLCQVAIS